MAAPPSVDTAAASDEREEDVGICMETQAKHGASPLSPGAKKTMKKMKKADLDGKKVFAPPGIALEYCTARQRAYYLACELSF